MARRPAGAPAPPARERLARAMGRPAGGARPPAPAATDAGWFGGTRRSGSAAGYGGRGRGGRAASSGPRRYGAGSSGRRGSARPLPAARARTTPAAAGGPGAPRGLTRRAAVLALLLVVVAVLLAPYLRAYVQQRAEIAALEQEVAERRQRVAELEEQSRRWQDPAYVAAQARERLRFVWPGETGYVVLDAPQEQQRAADPARAAAVGAAGEGAWFSGLWASVVEAGEDGTAPVPRSDAADDGTRPGGTTDPDSVPAP